jgi:hypothetical protein
MRNGVGPISDRKFQTCCFGVIFANCNYFTFIHTSVGWRSRRKPICVALAIMKKHICFISYPTSPYVDTVNSDLSFLIVYSVIVCLSINRITCVDHNIIINFINENITMISTTWNNYKNDHIRNDAPGLRGASLDSSSNRFIIAWKSQTHIREMIYCHILYFRYTSNNTSN